MIDLEEENSRKTRCLLVGEPGNDLRELKGLVETLGMECAESITLSRLEVSPAYGMGSGKANEISGIAKENRADCIIFDFNLEPTKQRNWENLSKIPCFDRQEVIIRIFAQRARTREATLQVELARLNYSLPRLAHSYGDMARQRGGSYGSKGSGETQLELDHRQIRERIAQTKKELQKLVSTRNTQKKKRASVPVPECALIGYTNAGKSSLLNALTGSDSFVEDKLFATLDPLTRKLNLKDGKGILLTDTVGFISNLPHSLIDAFKSTLSAAKDSDLLLFVLDASDVDIKMQHDTVVKVLEEIGAAENPRLMILNKDDLCQKDGILKSEVRRMFPDGIFVSAKTHCGFEELSKKISEKLLGEEKTYRIPLSESDSVQTIRTKGVVILEEWLEKSVRIKCRLPHPESEKFEKFIAEDQNGEAT